MARTVLLAAGALFLLAFLLDAPAPWLFAAAGGIAAAAAFKSG